jgi:hypothetical protein
LRRDYFLRRFRCWRRGVLWRFRGQRRNWFSGGSKVRGGTGSLKVERLEEDWFSGGSEVGGVSDVGEGEFSGGSEVRGGRGSQEVRWVGQGLERFSGWKRAGSQAV